MILIYLHKEREKREREEKEREKRERDTSSRKEVNEELNWFYKIVFGSLFETRRGRFQLVLTKE